MYILFDCSFQTKIVNNFNYSIKKIINKFNLIKKIIKK